MSRIHDSAAALTVLVVPCFNEAERLDDRRFIEFLLANDAFRVLFVNDGSTDRTVAVLQQIQQAVPPHSVDILSLSDNQGKAEAVRQGILYSLERLNTEKRTAHHFLGYFDADLATPLEEIPRLVEVAMRRRDISVVVATRMNLQGRKIERARMRSWCGVSFALAAGCMLGLRMRDTQCGAKIFRVQPSVYELFRDPFMSRWLFDVELFARMRSLARSIGADNQVEGSPHPLEIFEYPLEQWRDVAGSKLRLRVFLRAPLELIRIASLYRFGIQTFRHPRHVAAARCEALLSIHPAHQLVTIPFPVSERKVA